MLEIMKDSRLGSNGALALILYFLIKFVLLYSLLMEDQGETVFAVLTYPVVARLVVLSVVLQLLMLEEVEWVKLLLITQKLKKLLLHH